MQVAIAGAGIVGCATAIVLRDLGVDVDIFERDDEPRTLGAGVVCWPNATFVLEQLGVLDAVIARGHRIVQMQRLDSQGRDLGSLPVSQIDDDLGHPSVSIRRADLHRILLDAAIGRGARIHHGRRVASVRDGADDRAALVFADGAEIGADLIIGADGRMHSAVRRYVTGDSSPRFGCFANWIGVQNGAAHGLTSGVVLDMWGEGLRFGIVPLSDTSAYWAGGASMREPEPCGSTISEHLRALFGDWPEPVTRMIAGSDEADLREIFVYDHDPLTAWHRRNALVLGDAAHAALPTSGQGACQALEDAWHLGRILAEHQDVEHACLRLFARRSKKTQAITAAGRRLAGSLFNPDPTACARRNADSVTTDFVAAARGIGRLWGDGLPLRA